MYRSDYYIDLPWPLPDTREASYFVEVTHFWSVYGEALGSRIDDHWSDTTLSGELDGFHLDGWREGYPKERVVDDWWGYQFDYFEVEGRWHMQVGTKWGPYRDDSVWRMTGGYLPTCCDGGAAVVASWCSSTLLG